MEKMLKKKYFDVAGHVFTLEMGEGDRLWDDLDNYAPFECVGNGVDAAFSLSLCDDIDVSGKKEMYVSTPVEGDQRIDIYSLDEGYLFEMAPLGDVPVCGFLQVSGDFSMGRLKVLKAKRFCVNNALMLMYAFRTAPLGTLEMHASVTVKDGTKTIPRWVFRESKCRVVKVSIMSRND